MHARVCFLRSRCGASLLQRPGRPQGSGDPFSLVMVCQVSIYQGAASGSACYVFVSLCLKQAHAEASGASSARMCRGKHGEAVLMESDLASTRKRVASVSELGPFHDSGNRMMCKWLLHSQVSSVVPEQYLPVEMFACLRALCEPLIAPDIRRFLGNSPNHARLINPESTNVHDAKGVHTGTP